MLVSKRSVHELALEGDIKSVQELSATKPGCVKTKDDSGRLPLHWAVSKGHTELAAWLPGCWTRPRKLMLPTSQAGLLSS